MTVPQVFARTGGLIGGGTGVVDTIDGGRLNDGDLLLACPSDKIMRPYRLNATSGASESSPDIISPNTNAGNKRHILASFQANLLYGNGLVFPATQIPSAGANVLDDYEEGTWTMGLSFGGGATGIAYVANAGYYTKIGNICVCSGYLVLTNKGISTGDALITGLPFTCNNNVAAYSAANLRVSSVSFADAPQGVVVNNTTTIQFSQVTNAGTWSTLKDTNFGNSSTIQILAVYRVA